MAIVVVVVEQASSFSSFDSYISRSLSPNSPPIKLVSHSESLCLPLLEIWPRPPTRLFLMRSSILLHIIHTQLENAGYSLLLAGPRYAYSMKYI